MGYKLEGSILEVCNCQVLCPCWIGEDPDNGTCESALAYHFDKGKIDGVDISGVTFAMAGRIPGNVLDGNFLEMWYVSENASDEQHDAIVSAFRGEKGGPLEEFAQLIGEVRDIRRVPITFEVTKGKGTLKISDSVYAEMEPYRGPTGEPTQLVESIFSTIPGSPAYVAKADTFKMALPEFNIDLNLRGHNAIQGSFLFES